MPNLTSRLWYVVALAILLAGAGGALWIGMLAVAHSTAGFDRVVVPGSAVLTLDERGAHTIYHERRSTVDGRVYTAAGIEGLRVELTSEPGGRVVRLAPPRKPYQYSIDGNEGVAAFSFDIAEPGRYRLVAAYHEGQAGGPTVLAFEHRFMDRMLSLIFEAFAVGAAGVLIATVIAAVTYAQRRQSGHLPPTGR